jgi:DNA-binding response OmpR family regulator
MIIRSCTFVRGDNHRGAHIESRRISLEHDGLVVKAGRASRGHFDIHLSPLEETILKALLFRLDKLVLKTDILGYVYPDPWAEPDSASKVLEVTICRLRKKLEPLGLTILSNKGWGYEAHIT